MRLAPEAWQLVLPILSVALIAGVLANKWDIASLWWSAAIIAVVSICIALFFRNPRRTPPRNPAAVVSPADGKVIATETLSDGRKRVAIFLSVFNVHVNRVPISCEVQSVVSKPGSYLHAGSDEASAGNARIDVIGESKFGAVEWSQISGLLARKISCKLKVGDSPKTGDEYGLIYFGSRMEVVLPTTATIACNVNDKAVAGETIIALFDSSGK